MKAGKLIKGQSELFGPDCAAKGKKCIQRFGARHQMLVSLTPTFQLKDKPKETLKTTRMKDKGGRKGHVCDSEEAKVRLCSRSGPTTCSRLN